jgi:isoleucyl-tRNA synthetase
VGKDMKAVAEAIGNMTQGDIGELEEEDYFKLDFKAGGQIKDEMPEELWSYCILNLRDVEIIAEDVPGWQVANLGKLTVALDVTITDELKQEGISRELINRIQNLRKGKEFEVTDKINVKLSDHPFISKAVNNNLSYICAEILAECILLDNEFNEGELVEIDGNEILIAISKI